MRRMTLEKMVLSFLLKWTASELLAITLCELFKQQYFIVFLWGMHLWLNIDRKEKKEGKTLIFVQPQTILSFSIWCVVWSNFI